MSIDFTVMFKLYMLLIFVIQMRKYYTLVKKMGGKGELELETRKCLLYCLHVSLTTQKNFFPTAFIIIITAHSFFFVTLWVSPFHIYCYFHCYKNGDISHVLFCYSNSQ